MFTNPSLELVARIEARFESTVNRIHEAARQSQRNPGDIQLVVVTKGHPIETVRAAFEAGARVFGENYPEEGAEKAQALKDQSGLEWHMIGHVQSRKSRLVCENFAWVHSVDSLKLAQKLDRAAAELGSELPVLLECNTSGEESKYGFQAVEEADWEGLAGSIEPILRLEHIQVRGLMTMAPYALDPEAARPFFRRLRRLSNFLASHFLGTAWQHLSMGMSGDFEAAIKEGATLVRIGEAILGPRPGKP